MDQITSESKQTTTATAPCVKGYLKFSTQGLHGKEELVERVKQKAGELWDLLDEGTNEPGTEGGRYYALAKTSLEESVMWFTKGVSRSVAN